MPALEEDELQRIHQAVATFSEDALRYAIEQARDPEKAAQLVDRLREDVARVREDVELRRTDYDWYPAAALCVVLGEAKVEAAIPVMLPVATESEVDLGILQEAAMYALQRMGDAALMATMSHIESSALPGARVYGYDILQAALDADDATRLAVGQFCFSRLPVESAVAWPKNDWNPLYALMNTLVALGEQRVAPELKKLRDEATSAEEANWYSGALELLEHGERPEMDVDWRTDWPEQCEAWGELAEEIRLERETHARFMERVAFHEGLVEEYRQSLLADGAEEQASAAAQGLKKWLLFAAAHGGLDLRTPDVQAFERTIFQKMPAEYRGDGQEARQVLGLLKGLVEFLSKSGRWGDPQAYLEVLHKAHKRVPERMDDRDRWSFQKEMYMVARQRGYDADSEEGMVQFMTDLLQTGATKREARPADALEDRLLAEFEPPAEEAYYGEALEPIRRTTPKVGRNDPCPCGSGKKYKKCCGQ